jgi:transposase
LPARLSRKGVVSSGALKTIAVMPQNFLACVREQVFLMPPDVREWLPEGHLAWFVLDAVGAMDLDAFYGAYRADGHGRAAYEPAMMVALLLYAYARGVRSSRAIERACEEDVAFRVVAAQQRPDHATLARFVERHEAAIAGLFGAVLQLCAQAGLARVGVVAIDGTKVAANASRDATVDYDRIAREIVEEAKAIDAAEDERLGDARGDELPLELATSQGRRGWLREAKRRLDEQREQQARPVPRSRPARLKEAKRRLEEELWTECRANEAYEAYRARGRMKDGRRFGRPPDPYRPPDTPAGKINLTDPDSRLVKGVRGHLQGYNAQAATTEDQIVIAAEVTVDTGDFGHLEPMVDAARRELHTAGVDDDPEVVLADAGYWHREQMDRIVATGIQVLIPPDSGTRKGTRPGWDGGAYAFMRRVLSTEHGGELYGRRKRMIEPVFGDMKFNRRLERFSRRGRSAARAEWRLITATHNLLKIWRHTIAPAAA